MPQRADKKRRAKNKKRDDTRRTRELCYSAWDRLDSGDLAGCVSVAREALNLRPRDAEALTLLYRSASQLNQTDVLGEYGDTLITVIDELGPMARYNIGVGYFTLGRYADASRVLSELAMHAPLRSSARSYAENLLRTIDDLTAGRTGRLATHDETPPPKKNTKKNTKKERLPATTASSVQAPAAPERYRPRVTFSFEDPATPSFAMSPNDALGVRLRVELADARLARGFDELVCLKTARGVDHYWYQTETVRRALTRFRGRVLLADEVGLGKTVEAGMIAAEYLARGMARRVLVLVPASLVTQWREEFRDKFGIEFADAAERGEDAGFWKASERVVASIALARRQPHFGELTSCEWDLVIVDEAHRLKNRRTRGWELVNTLRPRFLLMLSATPVQNDIVELYNIVTLLRPGTLGTESEFKKRFIAKGDVKDVDALRDLLASVMVRNTRSLIDAKLPNRFADTIVVDPSPAEAEGLRCADRVARALIAADTRGARMSASHVLRQAGSSPAALASALSRLPEEISGTCGAAGCDLEAAGAGAKGDALLEIVRARPDEKIIVFTHFTRTLEALSGLLARSGIEHVTFSGNMSASVKEEAVARFRDGARVLVSTGSGGEGRNLQFARTVVNFDLPWNPMVIEQRIGRVHRLGQKRDVFVFNLALRSSLEDRMLEVLDRKTNMFELVIGEIDEILGSLDGEFSELVFDLWRTSASDADLDRGFEDLARSMIASREQLRQAKELDERLFGEDLAT